MDIITKTVHSLYLTSEEEHSLSTTYSIMGNLMDKFGNDCILQNPFTGEIIEGMDMARVRGIIDFLLNEPFIEYDGE